MDASTQGMDGSHYPTLTTAPTDTSSTGAVHRRRRRSSSNSNCNTASFAPSELTIHDLETSRQLAMMMMGGGQDSTNAISGSQGDIMSFPYHPSNRGSFTMSNSSSIPEITNLFPSSPRRISSTVAHIDESEERFRVGRGSVALRTPSASSSSSSLLTTSSSVPTRSRLRGNPLPPSSPRHNPPSRFSSTVAQADESEERFQHQQQPQPPPEPYKFSKPPKLLPVYGTNHAKSHNLHSNHLHSTSTSTSTTTLVTNNTTRHRGIPSDDSSHRFEADEEEDGLSSSGATNRSDGPPLSLATLSRHYVGTTPRRTSTLVQVDSSDYRYEEEDEEDGSGDCRLGGLARQVESLGIDDSSETRRLRGHEDDLGA